MRQVSRKGPLGAAGMGKTSGGLRGKGQREEGRGGEGQRMKEGKWPAHLFPHIPPGILFVPLVIEE